MEEIQGKIYCRDLLYDAEMAFANIYDDLIALIEENDDMTNYPTSQVAFKISRTPKMQWLILLNNKRHSQDLEDLTITDI